MVLLGKAWEFSCSHKKQDQNKMITKEERRIVDMFQFFDKHGRFPFEDQEINIEEEKK